MAAGDLDDLVLAVLSGVTYAFARLEPLLQEYTAGMALIKPNTVLLPLNFSASNPV